MSTMNIEEQLAELKAMQEEPLHPDLVPHVVPNGPLGPVLKHPLVFDITVQATPGLANRAYLKKKRILATAIEEKNWYTFIGVHERPYRLSALLDLIHAHKVDRETVVELARFIWTDSENIWENFEQWREILTEYGLGDDPEDPISSLPEEFIIYRGYQKAPWGEELNFEGFSWTRDKQRALFFARRFQDEDHVPMLAIGQIKREDVIAWITDRSEAEVVCLPEKVDVKVTKDL